MFWRILSRTLQIIFGGLGLVMQGLGYYFVFIRATQPPFILEVSIIYIGAISFTCVAISVIAQQWWYIHKLKAPMNAVQRELKSKIIAGFSMLQIFEALREKFSPGLPYTEVHEILSSKLYRGVAWGIHTPDILTKFMTLGIVYSKSNNPNSAGLPDSNYMVSNNIYYLTDTGKLLAHKLTIQKPEGSKEIARSYEE
jgi:hypothetical protein